MTDVAMHIYSPQNSACGCRPDRTGDIAGLLFRQNLILESLVCSFREAYGLGMPDTEPADEYTTGIFTVGEDSRLYITFTPIGLERTLKAMIRVSDECGRMQCDSEIITITPSAKESSQTVAFHTLLEAGDNVELLVVGPVGTYSAQLRDTEENGLMTFHSGLFHRK